MCYGSDHGERRATVLKDRSTKRDRIAQELRRRILSNEVPRGARLRQDELAAELDSSITPVREAIRVLEAEGLVVSEPRKAVRVAGLDLEKSKAVYMVRRLVESYAMRRAVLRLSPLDIKHAWSLVEDMRAGLERRDAAVFQDLNRQFHFFFYERCGVPALCQQIDGMWRSFPWDVSLDSLQRDEASLFEHIAILEAVESGDADKVAQATEHHVAQGFLSIVARATGQEGQDPFLVDAS